MGVVTWIVLASLVVGKPLGILLSTRLSKRAGLQRPAGLEWLDLAIVGAMAGIGFTVALFFTAAAFEPGVTLDEATLGALLGVFAGALAIVAARRLEVGRTSAA